MRERGHLKGLDSALGKIIYFSKIRMQSFISNYVMGIVVLTSKSRSDNSDSNPRKIINAI